MKGAFKMNLDNINWGIVGCGDVAEIKSGPAFQKADRSSLIAVMRRNEEKARDFAFRHNVPNWTTNATELINNEKINSIYIATPPSSHLKYTLQAIEARKNVYLEKPMVLNSYEANILSNALKKSDVKLTVAHYRRRLPLFLKVKELLESNIIGKVFSVEIDIKQSKEANIIAKTDKNWRLDPEISGGGYFHDIAPHQLDLMCYYFGDVVDIIKSRTEKNESQNHVVKGELKFENGIWFKGSWNFMASVDYDCCIIHGKKGKIVFSFYGNGITVSNEEEEQTFRFNNPIHVQQPMIEKVVGYFLGKNENPCSFEEAKIVTKIMDTFCEIE